MKLEEKIRDKKKQLDATGVQDKIAGRTRIIKKDLKELEEELSDLEKLASEDRAREFYGRK